MTDKEKLIKLKKLADAMYYAAQYLTTDASRLHKAMDEYHKFTIHECKEELVSEDLEEASKEWLRPQLDKSYVNYGEAKMMELTHFDGYAMLNAIEFGAEWQKAKDESTTENLGEYINELSKQFPEVSFAKLSRIAVRVAKWQEERDEDEIRIIRELLDNFDKTCDEYHDAGFKHGQEALMKDATETTVHIGAGNYPYIPQIELYDYDKDVPLAKEGDKYKVVLIKED